MTEEKPEIHPDFNKKSSTGMEPKIAVLISHIGFLVGAGWLSGLIIYLLEKENRFVKFHAMQSLVIGVAEIILLYYCIYTYAGSHWSILLSCNMGSSTCNKDNHSYESE